MEYPSIGFKRGIPMAPIIAKTNAGFSVKAYPGDAKTMLAFNLPDRKSAKNLAGFTIQCRPNGLPAYYLHNRLRYEVPGRQAQDAQEPPTSSLNAPIHKFRWLHVPGSVHQGTKPFWGRYTYTVTPRFVDDRNSLRPIDPNLSVAAEIDVVPFRKSGLELGFTRGYIQSQAFVQHFGLNTPIRPAGKQLRFKTTQESGINGAGLHVTFRDEYEWLGFTAREKIFAVLDEVAGNADLSLDVFAYDLNEPDFVDILLRLAPERRVRIILDNAALHHDPKTGGTPEDEFETLFNRAAGNPPAIRREKFKRYAHDKIFIVSDKKGPVKVLTGSTNFSVNGLYVNANHVIVFNDAAVAAKYAEVFEAVWRGREADTPFAKSDLAQTAFSFPAGTVPATGITFSPHPGEFAARILEDLAARIEQEGKKSRADGSVLFAVMDLVTGSGPVFPALKALHKNQSMFSYGISDSPGGICLYKPGQKTGLLVTGKAAKTKLPAPFDQVPGLAGHEIHHKFVVCGFNGSDPVVYCGSSNLALGGEESNGDNLLAIHDGDVATAFAIEALALVDHYEFLDRCASAPAGAKRQAKSASKQQAAESAAWFLSTSEKWAEPYFDPKDLHCVDRLLFG